MARRLHTLYVGPLGCEVDSPGNAELLGVGEEFLESAGVNFRSGPQTRGRGYARNGAIQSLSRDGDRVQADVRGSGMTYDVVLRGVTDLGPFHLRASCDCPYSCAPRDWCKHAIAVSYAVAALLDGRVVDETGRLGGAERTVDRAELQASAAQLLEQPAIAEALDPDSLFAEATRWVPFPLR